MTSRVDTSSFENQTIESPERDSGIDDILQEVEAEKNTVLDTIGYVESIDLWEAMRLKCSKALTEAHSDTEKKDLQEKISELEGLEMLAVSEKITETLSDSSWKESQEVYSTLIQKIENSTLNASAKNNFLSHLYSNLSLTESTLCAKTFLADQAVVEKKIYAEDSYPSSLEKWKILLENTKGQLGSAPEGKYREKISQKITELKGNVFLAQSYTLLKKTKKNNNWKESAPIYDRLFADTKKNSALSHHSRKKEKADLLAEISDAQKITDINIELKEKNFYLIEQEEKLMHQGYRESQKGWKKMQEEYSRILRREDLPEKYREIFETKEKEMFGDFRVASLHADLENQKESTDSWEISEKKYQKISGKIKQEKKIPPSEKKDLQAKVHEYISLSEKNRVVKQKVTETSNRIEEVIHPKTGLNWEESKTVHEDLQKQISDLDLRSVDAERKKEVAKISQEISDNIALSSSKIQKESSEKKAFSPEILAEENPNFAYLYRVFQGIQFQKKKSDPEHTDQNKSVIRSMQEEDEISDTSLTREAIEEQQLQEISTPDDQKKTHTIDIASSPIMAMDIPQANNTLNTAFKNEHQIILTDSEKGVQLNTPQSQIKTFAKSMRKTLPIEISREFSQAQIEAFLLQESQKTVMRSEVVE